VRASYEVSGGGGVRWLERVGEGLNVCNDCSLHAFRDLEREEIKIKISRTHVQTIVHVFGGIEWVREDKHT